MDIILPEWLIGRDWLIGFEGEADTPPADDAGNSGTGDSDDADDDDPDDEGDGDDDEDAKPAELTKGDVKRLNDALKAARREARIAKRDARQATKGKTAAEKTEKADELEQKVTKLEERTTRLANKLRTQAVESAGRDIARELKFRDPDDALAELRKFSDDDLGVDQDPEEPEDVEIDKDVIREKLTALATRKEYLILGKVLDGDPTGSTFGGAGSGKGSKGATEQQLKSTYAALN